MNVYRVVDGKPVPLTIEEMADDILDSFDRYPPAMTRGRIVAYLAAVRDRTEAAFHVGDDWRSLVKMATINTDTE